MFRVACFRFRSPQIVITAKIGKMHDSIVRSIIMQSPNQIYPIIQAVLVYSALYIGT